MSQGEPASAVTIRPAGAADRAWLLDAIRDLQDHERALHDSRRPGAEVADAYLAWLEREMGKDGALLLAEDETGFRLGFVACCVEEEDLLAETADSNRFGYICDIYVVPPARGRRLASLLLTAAERHLSGRGLTRLRIGVLAANRSAIAAYEHFGFEPYELLLEKKLDG